LVTVLLVRYIKIVDLDYSIWAIKAIMGKFQDSTSIFDVKREQFDYNAKKIYLDILEFEFGEECNSLGWHSILHEYNTQYGNRANALRVNYFFDCAVRAVYYVRLIINRKYKDLNKIRFKLRRDDVKYEE